MKSWSERGSANLKNALELADDPVYFAEPILGDRVCSKPAEIMQSVAKNRQNC